MRSVVACVCILTALLLLSGDQRRGVELQEDGGSSSARRQGPSRDNFQLSLYSSRIYEKGEVGEVPRIDIPATIKLAKAAHANSYAYAIYPGAIADPRMAAAQLADLPDFARAAMVAQLDVSVYLVPPSEVAESDYGPFHWNYLAWTDSVARIAVGIPSIRDIIIDDFGSNTSVRSGKNFYFTPDYVAEMSRTARSHASWMKVWPVLYWHDLVSPNSVLADYRAAIGGVIFPYFSGTNSVPTTGNTADSRMALLQGSKVSNVLKCRSRTCFQAVFPSRISGDTTTDSASVSGMVQAIHGRSQWLNVWLNDDLNTASEKYVVEVLVEGRVVGRYPRGSGWTQRKFELTSYMHHARSSLVTLRLIRYGSGARYRFTSFVDRVTLTGFSPPSRILDDRLLGTPAVATSRIASLPLIFMTYASPLTGEPETSASADYVRRVLASVDTLKMRKEVDGSMIYNLRFEPLQGPADVTDRYRAVAAYYRRWSS